VVRAFKRRKDSTSKRILYALKSVDGRVRKVVKEGVTIVKFGRDK
jgi:hypothetical protein